MEPLTAPETFEFPFPPYDIQHEFMKTLYRVIEDRKLGIFESPTGTGKSLSIICGAIKWLKDHENARRESLNSKIRDLEEKKQKVNSASSNDWLTSQSQEIELQRAINKLKLDIGIVNEYDEKIEAIKKKVNSVKVKKWHTKEKSQDLESAEEPKEEKRDDEDLVLEEDAKDESDNEEDNAENKHKPAKIFICSRTHSQLAQFVGEILKSPYSQIRVASLASRQIYCVNPNVSRLSNFSLINERCLDLQKGSKQQEKSDADGKITKRRKAEAQSCKCPYYKKAAIEDLRDSVLTQVQDVEDLVSSAKKLSACPFYASRLAAEDAEVVLVPYNVLLHKATREANGIDLKDNVVIVDEAHNLLEAMAQMHNHELTYVQLTEALRQVKCYKQRFNVRFSAANLLSINQLIYVMSKLHQLLDKVSEKTKVMTVQSFVLTAEIDNYNMFKMVKFCKDSRIAQKVRSYALKYPFDKEKVNEKRPANKGLKDFLASIENKKNEETKKKSDEKKDKEVEKEDKPLVLSNPLMSVISFLEALTCTYDDGRIFIHEDKKLQFLLLNPSKFFTDIVQEARSVIVAGGTMNPISEFERLFVNSGADRARMERFSCDHIIPPDNILPIIVRKGPKQEDLLFNFESRFSMGNNLKSILQECCRTVKGGIVVFFPSYKYENWVHAQIRDVPLGRQIFREPQDRSVTVESVLEKYAKAISQPSSPGALLLSVVGGKLSEGLNFSDDLGRCVIVVGLPYANIMAADLKEKMAYWDKLEGSGAGRRFYENQCMKAVNQSIGRAVRHKNDYATILLLDERYSRASVKMGLPNWIKKSLKVSNFQETFQCIEQFFKDKTLE